MALFEGPLGEGSNRYSEAIMIGGSHGFFNLLILCGNKDVTENIKQQSTVGKSDREHEKPGICGWRLIKFIISASLTLQLIQLEAYLITVIIRLYHCVPVAQQDRASPS